MTLKCIKGRFAGKTEKQIEDIQEREFWDRAEEGLSKQPVIPGTEEWLKSCEAFRKMIEADTPWRALCRQRIRDYGPWGLCPNEKKLEEWQGKLKRAERQMWAV